MIKCGNISSFLKQMEQVDFTDFDFVLVHLGVNDIDNKNGKSVADDLQMSLQALTMRAPHVKIILSEVTPRRDGRNNQVSFCNEQLRKFASSTGVSLARHSNLNSEEFFDDAKHLC